MIVTSDLRKATNAWYDKVIIAADQIGENHVTDAIRELCQSDLFFLLTRVLHRPDIDRDWLFDRCNEVYLEPDGYIDLWAREHYKSTIITFGKTIQDILIDPELTFGIFSHTSPIAKDFLKQIKVELETNETLKYLFPEILWKDPKREAISKWSIDGGITVKRKSNRREATVEASGLVDGQPTSKHYDRLLYDVVTLESVSTPEQVTKTNTAFAASLNLGAEGGKRRIVGTRWAFNDTYAYIIRQGLAKQRIRAATVDGTVRGASVFMSEEALEERRKAGSFVFACQQLLNPKADDALGFDADDLRYYHGNIDREGMNIGILCDPANDKKKKSDYTVFWVIGLLPDRNYYVLDIVRDRLNLAERTKTLFRLHETYQPLVVGYEQYGMQCDIQHIEEKMEMYNHRFDITALGGNRSKEDRIRGLIPIVEFHRLWLPRTLYYRNYEKRMVDLVEVFIEDELKLFPVVMHDDMLDSLARITDPDFNLPFPVSQSAKKEPWFERMKRLSSGTTAQAA